MKLRETGIPGVLHVALTRIEDERGWFARSFCVDEFADAGIDFTPVQMNLSRNAARGTLRGMHYQIAPKPEPKLVRCTRGRIFDVAVDLRRASPTFRRWTACELDAESQTALFIPAGCAHGFLTLTPDAEVFYVMGERYDPELARGVRWDDPAFAIDWPARPRVISERDAAWPDFETG